MIRFFKSPQRDEKKKCIHQSGFLVRLRCIYHEMHCLLSFALLKVKAYVLLRDA